MAADQSFSDPVFEEEFCSDFARSQKVGDFALAVLVRLIGWIFTAVKTAKRGDPRLAAEILTTCIPVSLLPVLGMLISSSFYLKYRSLLVGVANIGQYLQVTLLYYSNLYYSQEGFTPSVAQSISAVLTANGVAYLILTTYMGALPFKWGFFMQTVYAIILVATNASTCTQSPALQVAYSWMRTHIVGPLIIFVVGKGLTSEVPFAPPIELCVRYQTALQLVLGVFVPCMLVYFREAKQRRAFLKRKGVEYDAGHPPIINVAMFLWPILALPWALMLMTATD